MGHSRMKWPSSRQAPHFGFRFWPPPLPLPVWFPPFPLLFDRQLLLTARHPPLGLPPLLGLVVFPLWGLLDTSAEGL